MEQIKIKDLTFFYNKQEKPAIENLSFNIEKGDFVVLCGKSGCGKSTLLRCLKPIIKPYGKTLGDIIFENEKRHCISGKHRPNMSGGTQQYRMSQLSAQKSFVSDKRVSGYLKTTQSGYSILHTSENPNAAVHRFV